ncbi:glucose-6-phosphate 1-dehydrogenase [Fructobacillus pseudoficulneus]|uniref:Glucose-6-phosphate 1-dehydrogenase n=1 Tax=Fructobacillus pseudoficulneus TaxID=220714 RepID=A0A3F3H4F2_9LACO|nr:glucose-6-phosphate dehydrogenase [Fructobacillus pseudoficulneus]GAP03228.1 glucose-6-phosphate 1-dehydrogenase [Fructobacillus pseudoficulneus]SEH42862.1 glucose-6-phosphate 1-dehydrogenase [Fructobacillus pseudoficulneus]
MVAELKTLVTFFGATGDLAKRLLYPSVFNLYKKGYLAENFAVVGTARQDLTDEEYREMVTESVQDGQDAAQVAAFVAHFSYDASDVTEAAGYANLKKTIEAASAKFGVEGNRIFYMSVAPRFFGTIAQFLKSEGLLADKGYNRIMIEKPFGTSYETAEKLQNELTAAFDEDQVYRIDHFLGKEMVLNIAPLRFGNPLINNAWNKDYIKNVQVTLAETLGVEERAGYYDTAGALLDMIQNHTMQIIGWLAMEEPKDFSDVAIRDAKNAAFSALEIYDEAGVNRYFVRGQYGAGKTAGHIAYNQEPDVPADSKTNTYIAGELHFNTPRWEGVPFYVRSGKRLTKKTTRIDVVFKAGAFSFGSAQEPQETVLSIVVSPDEKITWSLNAKEVSDNFNTQTIDLNWAPTAEQKAITPAPYERMLHDAMDGNGSNFADWHGVATAWKFTDAISDVYAADKAPLEIYESDTMGPQAADDLLAKNGDAWVFRGE